MCREGKMKRLSLVSRIRLRQAITYLMLPLLAVLITLGVTTDLFNTQKTAQAITLSGGGSIPETIGKTDDLILNGGIYYMDDVRVFQSGDKVGQFCSQSQTLNCDSKRHFKNLTLTNGAVLTHHPAPAQDTSVVDETTGAHRWRKVDIELSGDLKINSGSRIDVDGKGYPGGVRTHPKGYGPKGGNGVIETNQARVGANGGGNKGRGGQGYCIGSDGGCVNPEGGTEFEGIIPQTYNDTNYDFDFGSGGGHANQFHGVVLKIAGANGGAGGGRIKIFASGQIIISNWGSNLNSQITADGKTGYLHSEGGNEKELSGAGAGGSVFLSANGFTTPVSSPKDAVYGISAIGGEVRNYNTKEFYKEDSPIPGLLDWVALSHSVGADGVLTNGTSLLLTSISAKGGYSNYLNGYKLLGAGGGGGEVRIVDLSSKFNMYKKLENHSRNDDPNITFNPYALQVGDVIKVTIEVTNLTVGQTVTISDDILVSKPNGSVKCIPLQGTYGNGAYPSNGTTISWSITATSDVESVSYYCKVQ